jgi:hypothetical protein
MRTFRAAKERWDHTGETRTTKWRDTRRALLLGGFALSTAFAGTVAWVRDTREENQRTAYAQELSDYQRCLDRAKSGGELRGALIAGVDHAEETEAVFVLIDTLINRTGNASPSAAEFSEAVSHYQESIDDYRSSAESYDVVELNECPAPPGPP